MSGSIALDLRASVACLVLAALVWGSVEERAHAATVLATTAKPITAFAHSGERVAWSTGGCTGATGGAPITVLTVSPRTRTTIRRPGGAFCVQKMALSANRVVWQDYFDTLAPAVLTRPTASGPKVTLDTFDMRFDAKQFGPITGAAATLAYSLFTLNGSFGNITGGELKTVTGGVASPLAGSPAAALMAATNSRIALIPAPRTSNDVVEVRDVSTGALITSFPMVGRVRHIAMWESTIALLVTGSLGHQWIVTRDASTGAVIRRSFVSDEAGAQIDLSGAGVVYHVGGTIRLLSRLTGDRDTIRVGSGRIVGLSIEGRRIVWAVNAGTSGRVVTVRTGVSVGPTHLCCV